MNYKVLVLDIDGTLTNSKKEITPRTKEALFKIQEMGVKVVLASGRPTHGIVPVAEQLELARFGGYILAFNGGRIVNCKTGEIIYEKVIDRNMVDELYDLSVANKVAIMTYENDRIITDDDANKYVELESNINKMQVKKVDSFKDYVDFPVNKCLMVHDGEYLAGVEKIVAKQVGDRLKVCRSEPFFLEITPQNIDKAYSLQKLLDHLGLTKDEMIACGDGFNDLSMIAFSGLGVAMENAQDAVKKAADYITLSNDQDGVAHVIEKYIMQPSLA